MNTPNRYNPAMVVLHWLTVLLILGAGLLADNEGGGSSPIDIHMILGGALLLVLIIRIIVRLTTRRPAWASTGNGFVDRVGELVHVGLYFFAFLILIGGGLIAVQRNLPAYVMGTGSASYGEVGFLYGALHQVGWFGVVSLLILHIGAAVYHQFIIRDNLLKRMWFTS